MKEQDIDLIVKAVQKKFRTFGGGDVRASGNPIAAALKDTPAQFAAGVDVKEVVNHIISMLNKTRTVTMSELAFNFDNLMRLPGLGQSIHPDGPTAKGFTIGKGKKLYWYITPFPGSGTYRAIQEGYESKVVSIRHGIDPLQEVTIHYYEEEE